MQYSARYSEWPPILVPVVILIVATCYWWEVPSSQGFQLSYYVGATTLGIGLTYFVGLFVHKKFRQNVYATLIIGFLAATLYVVLLYSIVLSLAPSGWEKLTY